MRYDKCSTCDLPFPGLTCPVEQRRRRFLHGLSVPYAVETSVSVLLYTTLAEEERRDNMVDEVEESGETDVVVVEDSSSPEVDNSETVIEAPDSVVDASPTIIVETPAADESASDAEIDRAVNTAERLTALEGIVGGLVTQVGELTYRTESAQMTADTAVDIAVETVQEVAAVEEELEADEEPSDSGPHWWFESREDRKKRKGKS